MTITTKEPKHIKLVEKGIEQVPPGKVDDPLVAETGFLNRELTWLQFNRRVLAEAMDMRQPLLERLKFLAITASNLDEFFMKRIGGLKQQVVAGVHDLTMDGRTPALQIEDCLAYVSDLERDINFWVLNLMTELKKNGIEIYGPETYQQLKAEEKEILRAHYLEEIFPLITPLAMDPAHPFPHISNLSLNLLVGLSEPDQEEIKMVRIKAPYGTGVPRFIQLPDTNKFVGIEALIAENLDILFPDMKIHFCEMFRVIRNANTERNEEHADDLLSMIELELRDRRLSPIVRLEIHSEMDAVHKGMLAAELGLDEERDVADRQIVLGMSDLMELAFLPFPELRDPDHHPITHEKLEEDRSIFHIIRENGSILLQHPYESFATSVERFVREASCDPKVLGIKMTIYRTSEGTQIINHLIEAARRGKQVTVVVELKARFDEEANIRWANRLEEEGIHVTYGVVGLKTHCKAILVIRRDYSGLRRYAHLGTGNYHAGTARIYSDLGLLTCSPEIGRDLTNLFNFLTTGSRQPRSFEKILTSPKKAKKAFIRKIQREAEIAEAGNPALIRFKCNALHDAEIANALYEAGRKGVKIELIIRDSCCLIPGKKDFSENISVRSILGRFLEHTRIYYFQNGGEEEYFIGSADMMRRNLESRVEIITPIEDPAHREELKIILETQLADNRNAWEMQPDGSYKRLYPADEETSKGSQETFIGWAQKREKTAKKLSRRKTKGVASLIAREV